MKSLTAYGRGVERLLLLASALAAWGFWWWLPGRLPSEAGYEEVRSLLQREAKRGDVLLVFPWWAERVRLYAPPSVPVVGYLGSDEDDLEDFERIWVLGQPELPRARWTAFAERFLPGRKQEGDAWSFGSLRLSLYRNGRFRPPRASSDAWAPSAAFVESPRVPPTACSMAADALRCTGSPAFATGPQWHEVRYRPLKCLWLHPPGGSARLTLQYPEVPEGSSAALEAGLIWEHAAQVEPGLSPVRVTLAGTSAGGPSIELLLPVGVEGLTRAERPIPSGWRGGLRLSVESANPRAREVCVRWKVYGLSAGGGS